MNFINRERDPNLVKLQDNVFNQLQNIANPNLNSLNPGLCANPTNILDAESFEAQNAVRAALQEILNYKNNISPAAGS